MESVARESKRLPKMIGRVNFHYFGLNVSPSLNSQRARALIFLMPLGISNALDWFLFHWSKSQAIIILILEMKKLMPRGRLQFLWGPGVTQDDDHILSFSQVHFDYSAFNSITTLNVSSILFVWPPFTEAKTDLERGTGRAKAPNPSLFSSKSKIFPTEAVMEP